MAFMPWDIYEALDLLRRGLRPFYADMIKETPKPTKIWNATSSLEEF